MHDLIAKRCAEIAALSCRFGVERLEAFGSAARRAGFDPAASHADFLVTFSAAARNDLSVFIDFTEGLEAMLGRSVDLIEREAIEVSRNYIWPRWILAETEPVYAKLPSKRDAALFA
jgi:predicted nucleotidyltransferase